MSDLDYPADIREDISEGGEDEEEDEPVATSTADSINFHNPQTLFVVTSVAKAVGGFRPSILFDGFLATLVQNQQGATLQHVLGPELQMSFRYEPPSPKFTRQKPNCTSYRLQLLQGSQFLYLLRGLPKTLLVDHRSLAISWGQVHAVFQCSDDLAKFLGALRYVELKEENLWGAAASSAWLKAEGKGAAAGKASALQPKMSAWIGEYYQQVMVRVNRVPQPVLLAAGATVLAAGTAAAVLFLRGRSR